MIKSYHDDEQVLMEENGFCNRPYPCIWKYNDIGMKFDRYKKNWSEEEKSLQFW